MTPKGKKELITSLSHAILEWLEEVDPNSSDDTDIGFIGSRTVTIMATIAISALDLSAEAQEVAMKDGFLVTT